jgi:ankyrin repeat protein
MKEARMSEQKNPAATRSLPVRPNLDQLKHQAKDWLRLLRAGNAEALSEFTTFNPKAAQNQQEIKLSDAQHALARAYGASNWTRLVQSCNLIDAIWRDDPDTVRDLVTKHPNLLHENAGIRNSNWGPPMTYAANLGRDRIIKLLYDLGARDLKSAVDRAILQSKIDTARMLHKLMGSPTLPDSALGGAAYTLSATGTQLVLELGGKPVDENGNRVAPVDLVLETDSRKPDAKHQILELYVQHGLTLPDTPVMALHRGRLDLLEDHLRRDPKLLERNFTHEEIYPPDFGCHDEVLATQGTPLKGTTLLHLCADYDELEIARWLLDRGMDPDVRAAVDVDGFGGHTALFGTVVSQPNFWMNYGGKPLTAPFTELLLERGADPNLRASLRKRLHEGYSPKYDTEKTYEYRNVTALGWGRQFHARVFVNELALKLIEDHGGKE